ncbi:MAG: deoxyribodipyrimidine photo-lyase [Sedimentisphaerales bacterium]|nr:deoxyribodipyrimidine photo-lyase [Sedimentisphaerales bacterium]
MIHKERIEPLNERPIRDRCYILYWMQAAQRVFYNHALEYAIRAANDRGKPVVVVFGLTDAYPEANLRHYAFLLQGLSKVQKDLAERGIRFVLCHASPDEAAIELAKRADLVVVDDGPLRVQQQWRCRAAQRIDCPLVQVETNVIVPLEEASDKENFSAGTLRPRIWRQLDKYLVPLRHRQVRHKSLDMDFDGLEASDPEAILRLLQIDRSVTAVEVWRGGTGEAEKRWKVFLEQRLEGYDRGRNDPTLGFQSGLSPYLHFGQISPLYIALEALKADSAGKDAFLEELIVRRELSFNFVRYNPRYDQYEGLPDWALRTLNLHARDKREYSYSGRQLEAAQTHDPYWNAAQMQMVLTGKMHGYMRMYWGKKILEWVDSPKKAVEIALRLNNKYELDGRDPNAFAGVAWCFGKHDRAWSERKVFGKVRYMNAAGLKRKFDADAYVEQVARITR